VIAVYQPTIIDKTDYISNLSTMFLKRGKGTKKDDLYSLKK
jgi:hypothetical protein